MNMLTKETTTATQRLDLLRERLNAVLLGKQDKIEFVLACLLARGHLLLDDLPGLGKTTLAKAISSCFGASFARIQCTPDLLPTDVTGFNLFNQKTREFEFHPGPVFSEILLADELNRTTPRTQSALFEAMAERQVTIDGQTRHLSNAFFVIATQNPIDSHGAYPLPEAQLDRFAMKLEIGYPNTEAQLAILASSQDHLHHRIPQEKIFGLDALEEIQREVDRIHVDPRVQKYLVELCDATRRHEAISLGVSPRGMLIWQQVAKSWALLHHRDFVTPTDIQEVALPVVGVRIVTRSRRVQQVLEELLQQIPIPAYK